MRALAFVLPVLVPLTVAFAQAQAPSPLQLRVTVSVELGGITANAADKLEPLSLEQRVVLRLLQEGFAVVAPFARPDVTLSAQTQPDGSVKLIAQAGASEEAVTVSLASGTRAELQLEVSQKLVDLARSRSTQVAEALAKAAAAPAPEAPEKEKLRPVIIAQLPPPPPKPERVEVLASVGVDALWRGAVDPQLRVGLSVGSLSRVGISLAGGFSRYDSEQLQVTEWQATFGPRARLWRANDLVAHAALHVGVTSHAWRAVGVDVLNETGTHVDVLVTAPLELDWVARDWLRLGVRLAPGIAGRTREHDRDARPIYLREAARLEAGATLTLQL